MFISGHHQSYKRHFSSGDLNFSLHEIFYFSLKLWYYVCIAHEYLISSVLKISNSHLRSWPHLCSLILTTFFDISLSLFLEILSVIPVTFRELYPFLYFLHFSVLISFHYKVSSYRFLITTSLSTYLVLHSCVLGFLFARRSERVLSFTRFSH